MCFILTFFPSVLRTLLSSHCIERVIHVSITVKLAGSTVKLYCRKTKVNRHFEVCNSMCCQFLVQIIFLVFWKTSADSFSNRVFITNTNVYERIESFLETWLSFSFPYNRISHCRNCICKYWGMDRKGVPSSTPPFFLLLRSRYLLS